MIPTFEGVDHIHIYVSDRPAAEAWYRSVLGFERVPAYEFWAADGGPLTLSDSSDTVHLALFERPFKKNHATIALRADATQFLQWQAHLSDKLAQPLAAVDHESSWSIYFTDPDGNPYEITTYDYETLCPQLKSGTWLHPYRRPKPL